jgi:tetratricopeptide (TPR) repeat protein
MQRLSGEKIEENGDGRGLGGIEPKPREECRMKWNWKKCCGAGVTAGLIICFGSLAQAQQAGPPLNGAPASSNTSIANGKDNSPVNTINSLELIKPADRQEQSAFQQFQSVSPENSKKKIELGEAFLQKYQMSHYRASVYSELTSAYLQTNQVQKMEDAGEKALALNPKDVQVLAMLGQTLPRVPSSNAEDQSKQLEKAEQYSKRAIETIPSITKPENLTDAQFAQAKNQTLAIAHSGLGLVYFRRGNYAEAIVELDQSVKLDPRSDPVNYYVLGVANHNTSHFAEAVAAFSKCAEFQGSMQATCKESAEKDKAKAASQPATPK